MSSSIPTLQSLSTVYHGFPFTFYESTHNDWALMMPKVTHRYPREELIPLHKLPFPPERPQVTSETKKGDALDIFTRNWQ